ncbi:hypothetical protein LR48_Vigan07g106200 [Vigna angularis]|uniref:Uncharacterized protein n=1 Tax=Phaseolus angularis TaxID=3914 RepID=A0A0L9UX67_PHAAN|nr:hypothetical protein LR48_Vigan07g106200 [Vigna angularis]
MNSIRYESVSRLAWTPGCPLQGLSTLRFVHHRLLALLEALSVSPLHRRMPGCPQRQSSQNCTCLPSFGALSATLLVVSPACPYPVFSTPATCCATRLVAPVRALSASVVGP